MNQNEMMAFIQRIIDSAPTDQQAVAMLRQLKEIIDATLSKYPEDAELRQHLINAITALPELRADRRENRAMSPEVLRIARTRADERIAREASYRGRC